MYPIHSGDQVGTCSHPNLLFISTYSVLDEEESEMTLANVLFFHYYYKSFPNFTIQSELTVVVFFSFALRRSSKYLIFLNNFKISCCTIVVMRYIHESFRQHFMVTSQDTLSNSSTFKKWTTCCSPYSMIFYNHVFVMDKLNICILNRNKTISWMSYFSMHYCFLGAQYAALDSTGCCLRNCEMWDINHMQLESKKCSRNPVHGNARPGY